jgi:hypothetical protein
LLVLPILYRLAHGRDEEEESVADAEAVAT